MFFLVDFVCAVIIVVYMKDVIIDLLSGRSSFCRQLAFKHTYIIGWKSYPNGLCPPQNPNFLSTKTCK